MSISVRRACPQDAAQLFELNRAFNGDGVAPAQLVAQSLSANPNELALIAELDGRAIGFVCGQIVRSLCYKAPSGQLTELYVAEQARRRGVASMLVRGLEDAFRDAGVSEVTLLTGGGNAAAQNLYRSLGYAPSGEMHLEREL